MIQHVGINIINKIEGFTSFLLISLIERKGLLNSFCFGNACLFVLVSSCSILLEYSLVSWLCCRFWDLISYKLLPNKPLLSLFPLFFFFFKPLLSNRLSLTRMLHEIERSWYCHIIFSFTSFKYFVLLGNKCFFQLSLQSKMLVIDIFFFVSDTLSSECVDFQNRLVAKLNLFTRP